jgi:hypothetical protein
MWNRRLSRPVIAAKIDFGLFECRAQPWRMNNVEITGEAYHVYY